MKKVSLTLLAVLLFASVYGFAAIRVATADIPFSFLAEDHTYPAGTYRFSVDDQERTLTIKGEKPNQTAGMVPVVTRLAARSESGVSIIFDVVGNDHYLSEIHMPNRDGYYFKSASAKHTHVTVKGGKS